MEELHNIGNNFVKERLEHSEVLPPAHATPARESTSCGASQPSSQPCPQSPAHVGPAFHIPMTQGKSLEDLPSQLDFEWQDSVSPNSIAAHVTARSLGGELDVVGTPQPPVGACEVDVNTFGQVSQIAREACVDATSQPHSATTTDGISDASQI